MRNILPVSRRCKAFEYNLLYFISGKKFLFPLLELLFKPLLSDNSCGLLRCSHVVDTTGMVDIPLHFVKEIAYRFILISVLVNSVNILLNIFLDKGLYTLIRKFLLQHGNLLFQVTIVVVHVAVVVLLNKQIYNLLFLLGRQSIERLTLRDFAHTVSYLVGILLRHAGKFRSHTLLLQEHICQACTLSTVKPRVKSHSHLFLHLLWYGLHILTRACTSSFAHLSFNMRICRSPRIASIRAGIPSGLFVNH